MPPPSLGLIRISEIFLSQEQSREPLVARAFQIEQGAVGRSRGGLGQLEPRELRWADLHILHGLEFPKLSDQRADLIEIGGIIGPLFHRPDVVFLGQVQFRAALLDRHLRDIVEREIENLAAGGRGGFAPGRGIAVVQEQSDAAKDDEQNQD